MGTNRYDSLQARLERRFLRSFQFAANYTWSKAVGMAANDDSGLSGRRLPFGRSTAPS